MKDGIESLGRVRLQGIALLVVALSVGVLAGMALERVRSSHRAPPGPPPSGPQQAGLPPDLAQLDLTADQRAQIHQIFDRARPVTDSILAEMLPRLRMAEDSTRAQIRAVLTPEQQRRYDELRQREPRRDLGPGEGRPGPGTRPPGSGHGPPPGPPDQ
jgi:Spy/CpxP family protein refolding chaperone